MSLRTLAAAALFVLSGALAAQVAGRPPAPQSAASPSSGTPAAAPAAPKHHGFPKPAAEAAPGGGPDKVWVNINSGSYHCPGDRFYGKTAHGRYLTEAAAKSAGGHGPRGKTCFASK